MFQAKLLKAPRAKAHFPLFVGFSISFPSCSVCWCRTKQAHRHWLCFVKIRNSRSCDFSNRFTQLFFQVSRLVLITTNVVLSIVLWYSPSGAAEKRSFSAKSLKTMLLRITKIVLAVALSFTFTFSLWKIIICFHEKYFNEVDAVNSWLEESGLGSYKALFRDVGKSRVVYYSRHSHGRERLSLTQISIVSSEREEAFAFRRLFCAPWEPA